MSEILFSMDPWEWEDYKGAVWIIGEGDVEVALINTDDDLATDPELDTAFQNANLISAAPDMYRFLKRLEDKIKTIEDSGIDWGETRTTMMGYLAELIEITDKAEGKRPIEYPKARR